MKRFTAYVVCLLTVLLLFAPARTTDAQRSAPCGIADQLGFPTDNLDQDTILRGWDDFALFRQRFGGRHVGLDVAFRQEGRPILAAARGRVTYSDIEGWDTERGVVIVEHISPRGERFYTLYGHMEETEDILFPEVETCVELGDVVGVVGVPTLSLPHLHYEIRTFLPNDGGPGYTTGNPLAEGWYHPLDYTFAYELRQHPAFIEQLRLQDIPAAPPLLLPDGGSVVGSGPLLSVLDASGLTRWRVTLAGNVIGIAALPGGRVAAQSDEGQVVVLLEGRFQAVWRLEGEVQRPMAALGDTLVFAGENGRLSAYDSAGNRLWAETGAGSPLAFTSNGTTLSLVSRLDEGFSWRVIDATGQTIHALESEVQPAVVTVPGGDWLAISRDWLVQRSSTGQVERVEVSLPGHPLAIAADALGRVYAYLNSEMLVAVDSIAAGGSLRWQMSYPRQAGALPLAPRLLTDGGCALFALDANGALLTFSAGDGTQHDTLQLYAGGARTRSPQARLLAIDPVGRLRVGAGFLSLFTFDARALAGPARETCVLG